MEDSVWATSGLGSGFDPDLAGRFSRGKGIASAIRLTRTVFFSPLLGKKWRNIAPAIRLVELRL